jgi:hypothetical protein
MTDQDHHTINVEPLQRVQQTALGETPQEMFRAVAANSTRHDLLLLHKFDLLGRITRTVIVVTFATTFELLDALGGLDSRFERQLLENRVSKKQGGSKDSIFARNRMVCMCLACVSDVRSRATGTAALRSAATDETLSSSSEACENDTNQRRPNGPNGSG